MTKTTIEQNGSLKKVKKNLSQGREKMTSILDSNGQEITDQDEILKRIEGFYEQLYDSDKQTEEPEKSNVPSPYVRDWEVRHGQITSSLIQSKLEIM